MSAAVNIECEPSPDMVSAAAAASKAFLLDEDGNYILDEAGNRIVVDV